jgi:hypothetical protein
LWQTISYYDKTALDDDADDSKKSIGWLNFQLIQLNDVGTHARVIKLNMCVK